MEILRKSEELIYPAAPCNHPALHRLSETDQRRFTTPKLFFYEQGPASSEALKSSLSKTLALFYPLAGRLVERSAEVSATALSREGDQAGMGSCEGGGGGGAGAAACNVDGRMDVSCLDQGAVFCEAWTDTPLDAYRPDFQPHRDFDLLLVPDHHDVLLRVQVTHFACGGICLCVQAHHGLVDGASSARFMECWVDFTNGKSVVEFPYIIHPPLEVMYRVIDTSLKEDFSLSNGHEASKVRSHDTKLGLNKVFHFTSAFIETLKKETVVGGCKYSSFECIAAYLWRNMVIAKGIPSNEEVSLYYVVDGRRKLEPSLPQNYFGNAIFRAHASTKVSDLVDKPLSHLTQLIRESTSKVTDEYIRSTLEGLQRKAPLTTYPIVRAQDLVLSSWITFPLCDYDFGWGNPICCRLAPLPVNFGVMLPSSLGKGHMEVVVSLDEKDMCRMDSLFLKA